MNGKRHSRLRVPAGIAAMGTVIAGAVGVGRGWSAAITVEIFVFLAAAYIYGLARSDSDVGAVFGRRTDERQRLIEMKARELSMVVMYLASVVCVAIALSLKQNYWQADVIGSVGGISFMLGLMIYSPHRDRAESIGRGMMASSVHEEKSINPDDSIEREH
jgi:hypothetical protein